MISLMEVFLSERFVVFIESAKTTDLPLVTLLIWSFSYFFIFEPVIVLDLAYY